MNWIVASILMLVFSNIYYFIIKLGQNRGITVQYNMVANFSIPPFLYYFLGKSRGESFQLTWPIFFQILFIAVVFSWIGSYVSYAAMKKAPNAGYSVIITKSYGIFTSIAAIFLFGSTLTWIKFLAIAFVLFCTAIVTGVFEKNNNAGSSDYQWVTLSFISFFCFGLLRLSGKWLISVEHVPQFAYQSWVLWLVALLSVADLLIHRKAAYTPLDTKNIFILLGTGVVVTGFYGFLLAAELSAPNIGYVGAINTSSNAIFTILAARYLGDKITPGRYFGVLGVTLGIILLVL